MKPIYLTSVYDSFILNAHSKGFSIWVSWSLLPLLFIGCGTSREQQTIQKPNIILINVDDLGWKDVGYMGSNYYETPHIDQLASEGMVFTNAYAGAANCAPSRACMISGFNTPRHGIFTVKPSARGDERTRKVIPVTTERLLRDTFYTLPQFLQDNGYVTGTFGKWHIGEDPLNQGFHHNVGGSKRGGPGLDGYFSPYNIRFLADGPEGEYLTDRMGTEAIQFLRQYQDTTFFLYLPFYAVHTPIIGKAALVEKFEGKKGTNGQSNAKYAAMVASVDENIGRVLQTLKGLGLEENTLIIFTSDNGGIREISDQYPLRAGKGSYYEGGIRVPLAVKWPGKIKEGTTSAQVASNLDFYPTLRRIVNPSQITPALDGMDLTPFWTGEKETSRNLFFHFPIYLESYDPYLDDARDPLFRTRPGSVVISDEWKLHHYFEEDAYELYDLSSDQGERKNLYEKFPGKATELKEILDTWRKENGVDQPLENNPRYDVDFEQSVIDSLAMNKNSGK